MKKVIILVLVVITLGCATLTEDAMTPIAISFSDGSNGKCTLQNKRGSWDMDIPATIYVRKSDDALRLLCKTDDGRETSGFIESEMGAKIIASAIFLDLGITDAITDKHRKYAPSYVIPIKKIENSEKEAQKAPTENNKVSP
ncbi:MAG: hypothetical protein KKC21_00365 [Nitrospinae bacterium]|nr:hypothetical protein [Nitrospinota bacterium]